MPRSPLSLCLVTGCPNRVASGRCETHRLEAAKESDARRPNSTQRGYDYKWAAKARAYLSEHRECVGPACMSLPWWNRPAATQVDHIDGLGPLGPHGYDDSNLQALCDSCHSHKTATVDGGFGRQRPRG